MDVEKTHSGTTEQQPTDKTCKTTHGIQI